MRFKYNDRLSPERRWRFIVIRGVLGFGGTVFVLSTGWDFYSHRTFTGHGEILELLISAFSCVVAGLLWGMWTWGRLMRKYGKTH